MKASLVLVFASLSCRGSLGGACQQDSDCAAPLVCESGLCAEKHLRDERLRAEARTPYTGSLNLSGRRVARSAGRGLEPVGAGFGHTDSRNPDRFGSALFAAAPQRGSTGIAADREPATGGV